MMDSSQLSPALPLSSAKTERAQAFSIPVRIYYEDTDVGGVVYYANYLRYLERARTEWLRAAGFELDVIQRDLKAVFVVRRVEADYHQPALLGNMITVTAEPVEVGASKLVIVQRVLLGDELLMSAIVTLAFIASDLSGPIRMPPSLRAAMKSTILPTATKLAQVSTE